MFQYNHARYTSRGGSKPFLAGFQPPKTILTIRPALLPQESVLSCQFKHKRNFKPMTSHAVLTRCDRAFLCCARPNHPNRQQVNTNGLRQWFSTFFSTGALWSKCKNHGHVIKILHHQYKPTRFIILFIA